MDAAAFARLPTTALADVLPRAQVMAPAIRPLWTPMPRLAGPAYPVACAPGDNLMLHAAIHRAPAGVVLVAQGGDREYALAGGNVCAWAQRRGIAGLVADGLVRDAGETRQRGFPVFARGVIPIPGAKRGPGTIGEPVTCGGVRVEPGDLVVADEEGIVVVPAARATEVLQAAEARAARDAATRLEDWAREHRERVEAAMRALGR